MLQRPPYDPQLEGLYHQNATLRDRLKKMNEIEPYVEILLENNKKYQFEVNDLQTQNHRLRCRVDELTEESLRQKESHNSQVSILKNNFQGDIDRLIKQVKQIARDKDAMQHTNQLVIEQLQAKFRRESQNKRFEHEEKQRQLAGKISKLSELLRQNQKILEQKIWNFTHKEEEYLKQIDQLEFMNNNHERQKGLLKEEISILTNDKQNLSRKNKELQKQNQQTSNKWLKSEQDKSETILQLKELNKSMVNENENLNNHIRSQQKMINDNNRRIVNLTRECQEVCLKNNDLEANLRRVVRAKNDLEAEYKETLSKLQHVTKNSSQDLSCQAEQIHKLSEDNRQILKQNALLHSDCKDKNSQISDLLQAVDQLENKVAELSDKYSRCENENNKFMNLIKKNQQTIDEMSLQNRNLNEKVCLYTKHNETLEKMLEKEKRKNINLQTSRYQIQNLALGALSKPQEICKQYEREIQKMVQEFVEERKIQEQKNLLEINKLQAAYEKALRQKQEYFDRKILFLEKELSELRRN